MEVPNGFLNNGSPTRVLPQRLLIIGENRLELLSVEMQEARERLLQLVLLASGVAVTGLLAGLALSASVVVALWSTSPLAVFSILTALYVGAALLLYHRLAVGLRAWQVHSSTLNQLRKDREALSRFLS
jgi:uncharacterized membrane protein YqjE